MIKLLVVFLVSLVFALILMPLVIRFLKKLSANQTVLGYVKEHSDKNGTTTMGGVVFMLTTLVMGLVFLTYDTSWFMCLMVSLFFGVLGLMDDFLKVKYKQNLGLRPYQKIIGQVAISLIFALYVYFSTAQSSKIFVPFGTDCFDISWLIVPLIIIVLIATTNSVNLTDGLDGLAANVSFWYLIFFTAITSIMSVALYNSGETGEILTNIENINLLSVMFLGSILAFLLFNTSKATIFMGDAGSLCLGGYIGASACLLGLELILPILGICFVLSSLSVIIQVAVFKLRHKRVFKMAPFHHHLQMSGFSEPKVVVIYSTITISAGVLCLIFCLL